MAPTIKAASGRGSCGPSSFCVGYKVLVSSALCSYSLRLVSVWSEISCGSSWCVSKSKTNKKKSEKKVKKKKRKGVKKKSGSHSVCVWRTVWYRWYLFSVLSLIVHLHLLLHFAPCFQQLCFRVWHYNSTLHYCLIVLTLELSAAYPELHIFLRRADFVSPGNRSSNLSRVPPVGCRSPLCAW